MVVQQPQGQPATRTTAAHGAAIHVGSAGVALGSAGLALGSAGLALGPAGLARGQDPAMHVGHNHLLCNGPDRSCTL